MNEGAPRLSVIIPAYNAARTLGACLDALERQTVERSAYEIIVVDDGSTDRTCSLVQARPGIILLQQSHAGPAAARNKGAAHAGGDLLLFTDADCEPDAHWIERMAAPFEDERTAGVKGAYTTSQRSLVARFVQLEYEDKYERMARQESIDFVDTYAAAYRRRTFLDNDGFDTSFPTASVEDQELSFRLARRNFRLVFVRDALVCHLGHAGTVRTYARKKWRIGYWKVLVHRRHPAKLIRDSHTPQVLKVQILLLGLALLFALLAPFKKIFAAAAAAAGCGFVGTTIPFALKAWRSDPQVALAAPALLLVRGLALGGGFGAGALAQLRPWRTYRQG